MDLYPHYSVFHRWLFHMGGRAAALPDILRKIKLNIQITFSIGDTYIHTYTL
jgi:hypothetical protein